MGADGLIPTEGHAPQPAVLKHSVARTSPHHRRGGGLKETSLPCLIREKSHSLLVPLRFAELRRTGAPQKCGLTKA